MTEDDLVKVTSNYIFRGRWLKMTL